MVTMKRPERLIRGGVDRTKPVIAVYENPETSEVSEEFTTLLVALHYRCRPKAEIIRNGRVLAFEQDGGWALTTMGKLAGGLLTT